MQPVNAERMTIYSFFGVKDRSTSSTGSETGSAPSTAGQRRPPSTSAGGSNVHSVVTPAAIPVTPIGGRGGAMTLSQPPAATAVSSSAASLSVRGHHVQPSHHPASGAHQHNSGTGSVSGDSGSGIGVSGAVTGSGGGGKKKRRTGSIDHEAVTGPAGSQSTGASHHRPTGTWPQSTPSSSPSSAGDLSEQLATTPPVSPSASDTEDGDDVDHVGSGRGSGVSVSHRRGTAVLQHEATIKQYRGAAAGAGAMAVERSGNDSGCTGRSSTTAAAPRLPVSSSTAAASAQSKAVVAGTAVSVSVAASAATMIRGGSPGPQSSSQSSSQQQQPLDPISASAFSAPRRPIPPAAVAAVKTSAEGGTLQLGSTTPTPSSSTASSAHIHPPPGSSPPLPPLPATATAAAATASAAESTPAKVTRTDADAQPPPPRPLTNADRARYCWALVCACNVNRSMSAHQALTAAGFTRVHSYGTSDAVRLPGRYGPVAFNFGHPYSAMIQRLGSGHPTDAAWVTATGLRAMLERNVRVKRHAQRWQQLATVGPSSPSSGGRSTAAVAAAAAAASARLSVTTGPASGSTSSSAHHQSASGKGKQAAAIPLVKGQSKLQLVKQPSLTTASSSSSSSSSGEGAKPSAAAHRHKPHTHVPGSTPSSVPVVDHDFVLCFDQRVWEQVREDLRARNMKVVDAPLQQPLLQLGDGPGPAGSSPGLITATLGSGSAHHAAHNSVHVILLHTPDNLNDAAVAGARSAVIAEGITGTLVRSEEEHAAAVVQAAADAAVMAAAAQHKRGMLMSGAGAGVDGDCRDMECDGDGGWDGDDDDDDEAAEQRRRAAFTTPAPQATSSSRGRAASSTSSSSSSTDLSCGGDEYATYRYRSAGDDNCNTEEMDLNDGDGDDHHMHDGGGGSAAARHRGSPSAYISAPSSSSSSSSSSASSSTASSVMLATTSAQSNGSAEHRSHCSSGGSSNGSRMEISRSSSSSSSSSASSSFASAADSTMSAVAACHISAIASSPASLSTSGSGARSPAADLAAMHHDHDDDTSVQGAGALPSGSASPAATAISVASNGRLFAPLNPNVTYRRQQPGPQPPFKTPDTKLAMHAASVLPGAAWLGGTGASSPPAAATATVPPLPPVSARVDQALRDLEVKFSLPFGCMLHEEWVVG